MIGNLRDAALILAAAIVIGAVAVYQGSYPTYLATLCAAYVVAAVGYNLVLGSAGQMAFGQAGFLACGAYVYGVLRADGHGLVVAGFAGIAACTVLGFVIGLVSARTKEFYLALVTLAFAEAIVFGIGLWPRAGGSDGLLVAAPDATSLGYGTLVVAALVVIVARNLGRTRIGRGLTMLRDDPVAAQASGANLVRLRLGVFTLSAALSGLGGLLVGMGLGFISPVVFGVGETLKLLTMIVIGGLGSVWGSMAGAVIVTVLPELVTMSSLAQDLLFGAVVFLVLVLAPGGVAQVCRRIYRALRGRYRRLPEAPVVEVIDHPIRHLRWTVDNSPGEAKVDRRRPADEPGRGGLLLTDVTVRFGGLVALDSVSMHVAAGTVHALIGPNGAGKTTLVNAVAGNVAATGRITLDGRDLSGRAPHTRISLGVARTFQHAGLFASLTIEENVMAGMYARMRYGTVAAAIGLPSAWRTERRARTRARELLELVGLDTRPDALPGELPGGQRRMVGLARALAAEPAVLLADELAAGMNDNELASVAELLQWLNATSGLTILLIEHNIDFVTAVASTATALDGGRMLVTGATEDVLTDDRVVEAYVGR